MSQATTNKYRANVLADWTSADFDSYQVLAAMHVRNPIAHVRIARALTVRVRARLRARDELRARSDADWCRAQAAYHRDEAARYEAAGDMEMRDFALRMAANDDQAVARCERRIGR